MHPGLKGIVTYGANMQNMKIPFYDLKYQHSFFKAEFNAVLTRTIQTSDFIGGNLVESFEADLAAYIGVAYAVTVNSGTDALIFALRALGIGSGDM